MGRADLKKHIRSYILDPKEMWWVRPGKWDVKKVYVTRETLTMVKLRNGDRYRKRSLDHGSFHDTEADASRQLFRYMQEEINRARELFKAARVLQKKFPDTSWGQEKL